MGTGFIVHRGGIDAPEKAPQKERQTKSKWKTLFDSMNEGDWFLVSEEKRQKVAGAANNYVRGKYTLYRTKGGFCFVLKSK